MTSPGRRASLPVVLLAALLGLAIGAVAFALTRGGSSAPRAAAPTAAAPLVPSAVVSGGTTSRGSLPPEAAAEPSGTYYAVFLAVAPTAEDAKLLAAQARAKQLGYTGGIGDIDCTTGARAALRLPAHGTYAAYSVFFSDPSGAQAFARAYGTGVIGTARITLGCD